MSVAYSNTDNPAWQSLGYGTAVATFTDAAIGAAAADRVVMVSIGYQDEARTISSVTIGGSAADGIVQAAGIGWAYRTVSSGTTATVVVTWSSALDKVGITVGRLTGADTSSVSDEDEGITVGVEGPFYLDAAITIPTDGIGLVAGRVSDAGTTVWTAATYAGYSEDGGFSLSTAWSTSAGSWNPALDEAGGGYDYDGIDMYGLTWAPAPAGGIDATNYLENAVLDHTIDGTPMAQPSAVYISLHSADPTDAGTVGEISGGSYSRQVASSWAAASGGSKSTSGAVTLTGLPATTISGYGIWDASSAGNCLYTSHELPAPITVGANDELEFASGDLTVTLD